MTVISAAESFNTDDLLDVLFVGAGTTGTLMGCARYFRNWHRPVHVVAVDSVGSVTFGSPPTPRMIPGLGTSVRPPTLDESFVDEVVHVAEPDTVRTCHAVALAPDFGERYLDTLYRPAWLAEHFGLAAPSAAAGPPPVHVTVADVPDAR